MSTISNISNIFHELGFTDSQLAVYTALAGFGKARANQVAKKTELPRSTVYSVLESLIPTGLVSIDESSSVRFFIANPPQVLKQFIKTEKERTISKFQAKEELAEVASNMLLPFFQERSYSIPKMQFIEGEANIQNMLYESSNTWQESISSYDLTWWGYQDHNFVEQYREWLNYYWNQMLPTETVKLLTNKSSIEKELKGQVERRNVKIVKKEYEFSSTIWVLGEYIVSISTRQKPHYAFQIKDTAFSDNLRKLFQMYWNS